MAAEWREPMTTASPEPRARSADSAQDERAHQDVAEVAGLTWTTLLSLSCSTRMARSAPLARPRTSVAARASMLISPVNSLA